MILWDTSEVKEPARAGTHRAAPRPALPSTAPEQIRKLVLGLLALDAPAEVCNAGEPAPVDPGELLRRHREALRLYTERLRAVAQ
jgi:hypothetical protein